MALTSKKHQSQIKNGGHSSRFMAKKTTKGQFRKGQGRVSRLAAFWKEKGIVIAIKIIWTTKGAFLTSWNLPAPFLSQ